MAEIRRRLMLPFQIETLSSILANDWAQSDPDTLPRRPFVSETAVSPATAHTVNGGLSLGSRPGPTKARRLVETFPTSGGRLPGFADGTRESPKFKQRSPITRYP